LSASASAGERAFRSSRTPRPPIRPRPRNAFVDVMAPIRTPQTTCGIRVVLRLNRAGNRLNDRVPSQPADADGARVPNRVPKGGAAEHGQATGKSPAAGDYAWRDPDSNRGHHDFQARGRNDLTAAKVPQFSGFSLRGDCRKQARKLRSFPAILALDATRCLMATPGSCPRAPRLGTGAGRPQVPSRVDDSRAMPGAAAWSRGAGARWSNTRRFCGSSKAGVRSAWTETRACPREQRPAGVFER